MNHKKQARGVRRGKGRNSTRMFRITSSRNRFRRNGRHKRPNHWHLSSDNTYSKNYIRDVELLWLQEHAPTATISYEKVHNCESMPRFKSGEWNGMAYFVRFTKEDLSNAIMFRILWWNSRA